MCHFLLTLPSFTPGFDFFSVCKQQDVGNVSRDLDAPVRKLSDNVLSESISKMQVPASAGTSQPGKASKGGRGSWNPPGVISPK